MATVKDLIDHIRHVLADHATLKIDFTLDGVRAKGTSLGFVSNLITWKESGLKLKMPLLPEGIAVKVVKGPPDREARYGPGTDTLTCPDADYARWSHSGQILIRECFRAYLAHGKTALTLTEEAIAHVAGALHIFYNNHLDPEKVEPISWDKDNHVRRYAFMIARDIAVLRKPGAAAPDNMVGFLKASLPKDPVYGKPGP